MLFKGVFVVVSSSSSFFLGVSTFFSSANLSLRRVFVMSRMCNNVEFDRGLTSKRSHLLPSNTVREKTA